MYKKLSKIFIGNNIRKFILVIFCISLSLTGFLISDNLVTNIQNVISAEARPILGGDIKISADAGLSEEQISYLETLESNGKIEISEKIETFSTIIDKFWEPDLASLVFIEENYPLYGDFIVDKSWGTEWWYFASQSVIDIFEQDGTLDIFDTPYKRAWVIEKFPEAAVNFYDEGKKVILPFKEFEKLWIEQFGARIQREYLIKVINAADFDTIQADLEDTNPLFERVSVRDYKSWGDTFSQIFSELDKYIKYILIVSFLLTILIIFLSVESFYIGNKKSFAILKILGLWNKSLISFNLVLFLCIFFISYIIAIGASYGAFIFIRSFELASTFVIQPFSLLETAILWIIILSISVIIPLIKFFSNNPLAGLKENFLQVYSKKEVLLQTSLVAIGLIAIYVLSIGSFISALIFVAWFIIWVLILVFLYGILLKILYKFSKPLKQKKYALYDAIRNTIKPGNLSILISLSFIVSFTSLLFISILSLNFLDKLNIDLSNNNNLYIINIPDSDIEKIDEQYKKDAFSVILARVTSINDISLKDHLWTKWESGRFTREFNITDSALEDVKIREGKKIQSWEVSVDYDFSQSLQLELGDTVDFLIYGKKKELLVTNIRESNSNNTVQPFFYFQVHPEDFENFPKNYFIATFVESELMSDFKKDLLAKTGSYISFIEIEEILEEVKSISRKALIVIQILFSYVFIFCIISVFVSVVFLIPFKQKKSRLYHILWASKKFIGKNNISEYLYLQVISTSISIWIASWTSYFILSRSDFIGFSWTQYGIALSLLFAVSACVVSIVYLLLLNIRK